MIQDAAQLDQAVEQLVRMYRALASLRADILPKGPDQFALLAEGPLDEIRRLEEAIHTYCGRVEAET